MIHPSGKHLRCKKCRQLTQSLTPGSKCRACCRRAAEVAEAEVKAEYGKKIHDLEEWLESIRDDGACMIDIRTQHMEQLNLYYESEERIIGQVWREEYEQYWGSR